MATQCSRDPDLICSMDFLHSRWASSLAIARNIIVPIPVIGFLQILA